MKNVTAPSHIDSLIQHAEIQCKKQGSRLTDKRKNVLRILLKAGKALSAYELVENYQTELEESIPVMSVYRILDFLDEKQLAHRLQLANKYVACEHIHCDYQHSQPQFLICSQCQKVKEISSSAEVCNEVHNNVEKSGFQIAKAQLEISCICKDCANEKNNKTAAKKSTIKQD
ncbi:Fur family transcriptional regulator [Agaribacterium haliotis]|uniref:Fur family transcriptional regulator n=1 Tax=Agaribacterium haliotis TaxID=2013869 RepID=UPI000BB58720|nr:Fur family transcriptional regulator [Agaribacterium haliotis]